MNKKILITSFLFCLLFTGCSSPIKSMFFGEHRKGKEGTLQETHKTNSTTKANLFGTVEFEPIPLDKEQGKPLEFKIEDKTIVLPANTKGKLEIGLREKSNSSSFGEISDSWKTHSGAMVLTIFGGCCIIGAIILCYLGMWILGSLTGVCGLLLIGCGVLIESFPWMFLIVVGIIAFGFAYVIYTFIKNKNIISENNNTFSTVQALTTAINKLPEESIETIKTEMKNNDNSAIIRDVTRKAMGKS